jgi:hypothetical protein
LKRATRIENRDAFHDQLQDIVVNASKNGVDVRGGWPIQGDDSGNEQWDVEIVRLEQTDE